MSEKDDDILLKTISDIKELDVPLECIPKDKELHWTRYFAFRRDSDIHSFDIKNVIYILSEGYTFCLAHDYPSLMTEAKVKFSNKYVISNGLILCERTINSKILARETFIDVPKWYQFMKVFKFIKGMSRIKTLMHENIGIDSYSGKIRKSAI